MSLHKSLKARNTHVRRRNVLSRLERIERLEREERWSEEGGSIFGLPKVRVQAPRRAGKEKRKAEAEVAEAQAAPEAAEGVEAPAQAPDEDGGSKR